MTDKYEVTNTYTPLCINRDHKHVAYGNYDGSWFVDWDEMKTLAELPHEFDNMVFIVLAGLFMAAKGRIVEVSRQRSDELGVECAMKFLKPEDNQMI